MKLIKISQDHFIIVDETIQPVNGFYYDTFIKKIRHTGGAEYAESDQVLQITHSTTPLESIVTENSFKRYEFISLREVKEITDIVDIEKKANDYSAKFQCWDWAKKVYADGYIQALEDNKDKVYTKEDMISAFRTGTNAGAQCERLIDYDNGNYEDSEQYYRNIEESFIESIDPKMEWEVYFNKAGQLKLKQ